MASSQSGMRSVMSCGWACAAAPRLRVQFCAAGEGAGLAAGFRTGWWSGTGSSSGDGFLSGMGSSPGTGSGGTWCSAAGNMRYLRSGFWTRRCYASRASQCCASSDGRSRVPPGTSGGPDMRTRNDSHCQSKADARRCRRYSAPVSSNSSRFGFGPQPQGLWAFFSSVRRSRVSWRFFCHLEQVL